MNTTNAPRHIAGINSVHQAIEQNLPVIRLLIDNKKDNKRLLNLIIEAKKRHIPVEKVDKLTLDLLVTGSKHRSGKHQGGKHQGVVAEVAVLACDKLTLDDILTRDKPLILLLESIQDPHNLGACLRSAAAAAVDAVIIPKNRAVSITPTVSKVASGGAEMLPIFSQTNLTRTLAKCQQAGLWALALTGHAEQSLYQSDLNQGLVIMLGNEEKGLSHNLLQHADYHVKIPMPGDIESLNVSVATGIVLFETLRQRGVA